MVRPALASELDPALGFALEPGLESTGCIESPLRPEVRRATHIERQEKNTGCV
jgi:hypothetical protein